MRRIVTLHLNAISAFFASLKRQIPISETVCNEPFINEDITYECGAELCNSTDYRRHDCKTNCSTEKIQLTWLRDSSPVFVRRARALQFRLDAL